MSIDVRCVRWREVLDAGVRADWEALIEADPRSPVFHRPIWLEIARRTGACQPWGVVSVHADGQPAGVFPLRKVAPWGWEATAFCTLGESQLILHPTREMAAWTGLAQWLRGVPGAGTLTLVTSGEEDRIAQVADACRAGGAVAHIAPFHVPTVLNHLPGDWDALLAAISPGARKELRKIERRMLEAHPDARVEFVTDPDGCAQVLETLVALYRRRWHGSVGGNFFDNPRNVAFYREALDWAARQGYAVCARLWVNEQPVIAHVIYRAVGPGLLHHQFISRDVDALPRNLSPGMYEGIQVVRWAMAHGMTTLNKGIGVSHFKLVFNGVTRPVWTLNLASSPQAAACLPPLTRALHIVRRAPVHLAHRLRHRAAQGDGEEE